MLLVDDGVSQTLIIGDSGLVISDSGSVLGVTIPEVISEVILSVSDMMRLVTIGGCHWLLSSCVTLNIRSPERGSLGSLAREIYLCAKRIS